MVTKRVLYEFTCERDKRCHKVFKGTYNLCNWNDIMDFKAGKQTLFCTTHCRQCKIYKHDHPRRHLANHCPHAFVSGILVNMAGHDF